MRPSHIKPSIKNMKFLKNLLLMILFMLHHKNQILAQDDSQFGFHDSERVALMNLKAQFKSSILDGNWTSLMCYLNSTRWRGIQCLNGRVSGISLQNFGLKGSIKSDALVNLTELTILSFKNNSLSGNVMDFSENHKLREIDLSGNNFEGEIPTSLLELRFLESLQLQENKLTGPIPAFNQSGLREFNVSFNNLSGAIPNTKALQSYDQSSYAGNENLCGPPSSTPCSISSNDGSSHSHGSIPWTAIIVVINVVALVVLLFLAIIYYQKYKKLKKERLGKNLMKTDDHKQDKMIEDRGKGLAAAENKRNLTFFDRNEASFELDDMLKASAEGLGKGNFGSCYRARLADGKNVVVKRLRDLKPLTRDEFVRQLTAISDLKHPNLLPLIAYFHSTEEKLLVHRFASNGNLFNRIHGGRGARERVPLRWSTRLSVARGVARALEYLHLNTKPPITIPHGNLKSSNVLFDENDAVLVSDYGLTSLIAPPIAAQRMVAFQSPEYRSYKKVSRKADVWSYGCLLLELLTGKLSAHSAPQGNSGVDLCNWAHRAVREEWTAEIFDVEILAQRSANYGMVSLMQIAMRCCDKLPEKRPEMSEVAREVENIKLIVDSEDEEDNMSLDQSLTDDSAVSATP